MKRLGHEGHNKCCFPPNAITTRVQVGAILDHIACVYQEEREGWGGPIRSPLNHRSNMSTGKSNSKIQSLHEGTRVAERIINILEVQQKF